MATKGSRGQGIFSVGGKNSIGGIVEWKEDAPSVFILPMSGKGQVSRLDIEGDYSNPQYAPILETYAKNPGEFRSKTVLRGKVSESAGFSGVDERGVIQLRKKKEAEPEKKEPVGEPGAKAEDPKTGAKEKIAAEEPEAGAKKGASKS